MPGPLENLDQWDDFVKSRYNPTKTEDEFRDYSKATPDVVREFYRLNHMHQTRDFVLAKKREFLTRTRAEMSVWEAMEFLNTLVDDSDPDTDLSQLDHLLQTAEAIHRDGLPPWFQLAGLVHDLGKILCLWGEPQWAVVGDTFPVGCAWSDRIVFRDYFAANPDARVPQYQTRLGVYEEGCGLDKVDISWGHDEYMYHVVREYLPEPALYMIRYHSFYPAHKEGQYDYLMSARDKEMFAWVRAFSAYDLYSKGHEQPDARELQPYYRGLIASYFPEKIKW